MKRSTSIWMAISAFLIVAGTILALVGHFSGASHMVWVNSDGVQIKQPNQELTERILLDEVQNIDIDVDYGNIYFEASNSDEFYCEYVWSQEETLPEIWVSENTLHIRGNGENFLEEGFPISLLFDAEEYNTGEKMLIISYPKDMKFDQISIEGDFGYADLSNLTATKLDIDRDYSHFTMSRTIVEEMSFKGDFGSVSAEKMTVEKSLDIEQEYGDWNLTRSDLGEVKHQGDYIGFYLDNCEIDSLKVSGDYSTYCINKTIYGESSFEGDYNTVELTLKDAENYGYDVELDMSEFSYLGQSYSEDFEIRRKYNQDSKQMITVKGDMVTLMIVDWSQQDDVVEEGTAFAYDEEVIEQATIVEYDEDEGFEAAFEETE